jgi:hypothetical protein
MPDTFGKRQRDAAKAKRRETKDARRAARRAGQTDLAIRPPDLPEEPTGDGSADQTTPQERGADEHS